MFLYFVFKILDQFLIQKPNNFDDSAKIMFVQI